MEKAREKLEKAGVPFRVIRLSGKGVSFDDVVKMALDPLNPNEICKTMIVKDQSGKQYGFLLKGKDRLDTAKAKEIVGSKISIVSFSELLKSTGVEPGAVCPLLLDFPLFVDEKVFETEKINFGSGDHLFGIEINSKELEKLVLFRMVSVAQ